jgi:TonB family protein
MREDEGMKQVNIAPATALLAAILPLASFSASAQNNEADISAKLKDKPLFLMGLWTDDKLKFDALGHPAADYEKASFTLSGIHVDKVTLQGTRLMIEGVREGLAFDKDGRMTRIPLEIAKHGFFKGNQPERIAIEIDNGNSSSDFGPALDAIFTEFPRRLAPLLPDYWQSFFTRFFGLPALPQSVKPSPQQGPSTAGTENTKAMHIQGHVIAPKLIHSIEPTFDMSARMAKHSGNVQIYLWVDESGNPSHFRLIRPTGLGLDERAIEAVKQYRFSPATLDGKPVKVDIYIDVNFQIF